MIASVVTGVWPMTDAPLMVHARYRKALDQAGLDSFDALWRAPLDDVEPGNLRRGGFSRVGRFVVDGDTYFLKRQQGQLRRSMARPLGRPTYHYEYRQLRRLGARSAPVPPWCAYGEARGAFGVRSVLVVKGLDGYEDLHSRACRGEDLLGLMPAVGETLSWFHLRHLQHMAVQPVHLFASPSGDCRIIDLERTRWHPSVEHAAQRDLRQLIRRSPWFEPAHLGALLSAYPASLGQRLMDTLLPLL